MTSPHARSALSCGAAARDLYQVILLARSPSELRADSGGVSSPIEPGARRAKPPLTRSDSRYAALNYARIRVVTWRHGQRQESGELRRTLSSRRLCRRMVSLSSTSAPVPPAEHPSPTRSDRVDPSRSAASSAAGPLNESSARLAARSRTSKVFWNRRAPTSRGSSAWIGASSPSRDPPTRARPTPVATSCGWPVRPSLEPVESWRSCPTPKIRWPVSSALYTAPWRPPSPANVPFDLVEPR